MVNKKSIFAMLLILIFGMSVLSGCSTPSDAPANSEKASSKDQTIYVGTSGEYFPWCFKKDDQLQGFEIDVWNEIGNRTGYAIGYKISKFSGLFGMLDAGQIDTIAHQISTTEERRQKYDFSETYAYSAYQFVVKKDSSMNQLEDFKGKKVGCVLGGNGEKTLRKLNEDHALNLEIVTFDGTPMEKDVEIGRLDAAWYGQVKAKTTIEKGNLDLRLAEAKTDVFEVNQYPFTKEEKNKQLIEDINKAIKEMHEDGTFSSLSEKWFGLDTTQKQ